MLIKKFHLPQKDKFLITKNGRRYRLTIYAWVKFSIEYTLKGMREIKIVRLLEQHSSREGNFKGLI